MTDTRILVVDDDANISELLKMHFENEGYVVKTASDGFEGIAQFKSFKPDLVLLDIMMPRKDGWQVCREIREISSVPIIMVTAKGEVYDKILGLEQGADDFVVKPFDMKELSARVKAVLHRTGTLEPVTADELSYEGLRVNLGRKCVEVDGEEVSFTRTEFELLSLLLSHRDEVFSRQQLIDSIWPQDVVVTGRTVDVNITRMRKKIGRYARCIATRIGYGYYFDSEK